MQKNMWCTMLILIPIMLEDNIMRSRDEMCNFHNNVLHQHGELQHHGDQVTIVKSLCSVDWTTSIGWSPKLSMLSYHNYVWQLSALLQPCKADHHHGWGHRRGSSIYTLFGSTLLLSYRSPPSLVSPASRGPLHYHAAVKLKEGAKGGMEHMQSKIYSLFVRYMDGTDVHSWLTTKGPEMYARSAE